jgi:hypothetical protein
MHEVVLEFKGLMYGIQDCIIFLELLKIGRNTLSLKIPASAFEEKV